MRSTIDVHRLSDLCGTTVFDSADEPIGTVEEIFYDGATIRPVWVGVSAGASGDGRMLVPMETALIGDGGLTLPYTEHHMRGAPPAAGTIGRACEQELRAYYGLPDGDSPSRRSLSDGARLRRWPERRRRPLRRRREGVAAAR
jgi:PRC-barrel domain